MAEELRFFLRVGIYSAVVSVIYWFASYDPVRDTYDWVGTVLLVATVLAAAAVVSLLALFARRTLHGRPGSTLGVLGRWLLLTDPGGEADDRPLSGELEPLPRSSGWPVTAAVAATLIAMGLVFGPWLTIPGAALLLWAAWSWVTQLQAR
jgi:hypothetical protein